MEFKWFRSGSPWIWLTGGAVSVSLLSVLGLLLFIGWKGLSYFWPSPLYQWTNQQGEMIVGQLYARESISINHLKQMNADLPLDMEKESDIERLDIKIANRDIYPADFISVCQKTYFNHQCLKCGPWLSVLKGEIFTANPKVTSL